MNDLILKHNYIFTMAFQPNAVRLNGPRILNLHRAGEKGTRVLVPYSPLPQVSESIKQAIFRTQDIPGFFESRSTLTLTFTYEGLNIKLVLDEPGFDKVSLNLEKK